MSGSVAKLQPVSTRTGTPISNLYGSDISIWIYCHVILIPNLSLISFPLPSNTFIDQVTVPPLLVRDWQYRTMKWFRLHRPSFQMPLAALVVDIQHALPAAASSLLLVTPLATMNLNPHITGLIQIHKCHRRRVVCRYNRQHFVTKQFHYYVFPIYRAFSCILYPHLAETKG